MRALLNRLPGGRITRWGVVIGCLVVVGVTTGWRDPQYQLGGSWIGHRADGFIWGCMQIPTDPSGKVGVLHVESSQWTRLYDQLVTSLGGDSVTDAIGEVKMISRDTARWTMIVYEQNSQGHVMTSIDVYSGTFKFTSPDTAELEYDLTVYLPTADANHDGFPDPGAQAFLVIPGMKDYARRIRAD